MTYYSFKVHEDVLDTLGNQGWELVSALQSPEDEELYRWIFKREKVEELKPLDGD